MAAATERNKQNKSQKLCELQKLQFIILQKVNRQWKKTRLEYDGKAHKEINLKFCKKKLLLHAPSSNNSIAMYRKLIRLIKKALSRKIKNAIDYFPPLIPFDLLHKVLVLNIYHGDSFLEFCSVIKSRNCLEYFFILCIF